MEDINAKVFRSTNVPKTTRRETPSTVSMDNEEAEMKRRIARRKELAANGGGVSGVPAEQQPANRDQRGEVMEDQDDTLEQGPNPDGSQPASPTRSPPVEDIIQE